MSKKIIFSLIGILIFVIIAGGFWWWWQEKETPIGKWDEAKFSGREDFMIKETFQGGRMVENEKVGLTYEIPKDWILENGNPTRFYSPDTEFKDNTSVILKKGCKVYVYASYIKTNLDTLKKYIDEDFSRLSSGIKLDKSSTIKVSGYSALRNEYRVENFGMGYISVDFPSKDKLYKIMLSSPIEEMEHCEAEFNKFLETISVK